MTDQELEASIKKMLEDTSKGLATKDELKTAVAEVTAKKLEYDEHVKGFNTTIDELKTANDSLAQQIKNLMRTRFSAIKTLAGMYNGVWGDLETAKNFGLFILAEVAGVKAAGEMLENAGIQRQYIIGDKIVNQKAMGGDDITTGGALIPTEFIPNLIVLMESYGAFRRNAQEWPMGSGSSMAPMQTSDVTVYCVGGGGTITASDMALKNVGLQAQKWGTITAIDSELTEDSAIAVGEIVGRSIARAFAKKEDQCAFVGDGTATYFGLKGIRTTLREVDATVTNVKGLRVQGTPGAWSAIVLGDLLAAAGLMPAYADDGVDAKWYCHKAFYFEVMLGLALGAGGAMASEIIQTGYTPKPSFLGRPVEFTQVMPSTKPAVDHCPLILGNLRLGTYLGDRRALDIKHSTEAYFATDQLGIRGIERIAITIYGQGDTTDPGPLVGLWADIA